MSSFAVAFFPGPSKYPPKQMVLYTIKIKKIVLLPILWLLEASGYLTSTEFRPRFAASATSATVVAMVSKSTEPTGIETSYHL